MFPTDTFSKTALQFEDTAGVHPGAEKCRSECEPAARAETGLLAPGIQPPRKALLQRVEDGRGPKGGAAAMERLQSALERVMALERRKA